MILAGIGANGRRDRYTNRHVREDEEGTRRKFRRRRNEDGWSRESLAIGGMLIWLGRCRRTRRLGWPVADRRCRRERRATTSTRRGGSPVLVRSRTVAQCLAGFPWHAFERFVVINCAEILRIPWNYLIWELGKMMYFIFLFQKYFALFLWEILLSNIKHMRELIILNIIFL